MNARVTFLRLISLSSPRRGAETLKEIKAAVAAMARRDPEAAHETMHEHVTRAAEVALQNLAERETQAANRAPAPIT